MFAVLSAGYPYAHDFDRNRRGVFFVAIFKCDVVEADFQQLLAKIGFPARCAVTRGHGINAGFGGFLCRGSAGGGFSPAQSGAKLGYKL